MNTVAMRVCMKHGKPVSATEFFRNDSYCKDCRRAYTRQRYHKRLGVPSRAQLRKKLTTNCKTSIVRELPPVANATGTWWRWDITGPYGLTARGWIPGPRQNAERAAQRAQERFIYLASPAYNQEMNNFRINTEESA